jgi:short-subunit dehydrogenase
MTRILIVGATSLIAGHCARIWAARGADFVLMGRNPERLSAVASDLIARGAASATCQAFDAVNLTAHPGMIAAALSEDHTPDLALIAHGELPDEAVCDEDPAKVVQQFTTNATSTIALVSALASRMKSKGAGTIAVISSVAGDRGRATNAHYGAAKAAVSTFCDGLRARLHGTGVHVITIKPGMVATPMTAGLNLPEILLAKPERVARDICRAIERRRAVIYTPWFWRWIMLVIRLIPERIFVRLRL